jgi:hypothetical protein
MENISRGPFCGYFVTILTKGSFHDITAAKLEGTRVQTPLSSSIKCNVLRESLSEDSQNILKRRGSWVISVYLWIGLCHQPREPSVRGERAPYSTLSPSQVCTFNYQHLTSCEYQLTEAKRGWGCRGVCASVNV